MKTETRAADAVERAYAWLEIKAIREDERVIEGIASTPSPDRVGDVVEPAGAKFKLPLPLLWQHQHDQPIGHVEFAQARKDGIPFRARILKIDEPGRLKDRLDEAWQSIKHGLVRAVSIGFKNIEHSVMEDGGWRFLKWEWLELSAVTIPANAEATITSIKSIDRELRGASAREKSASRLSPAGVSASHQSKQSGTKPMTTLSEQISALESEVTNIKASLKKIDVENMSQADEERFDELEADLQAKTKKIGRLKRIEAIDLDKAIEVKEVTSSDAASKARGGDRRTTVVGPNANIPKGVSFARYVICMANAQGNSELAAIYAERHYADDPRIANFARLTPEQKAAVPAAYTGGSGWADAIAAANTIGSEFVEFLRPMNVLDRINGFRRVPFNVKVSRQTTGQSGYWVGEALPTPLTKGVFDTVTMGKTKVGAISVMSKEQMRFSNINAEAAVRDDLARAVAAKMDSSFLGAGAGTANVEPAGLVNGVTGTASAGATADDVRTDLVNLFEPFSAANISRSGITYVTTENLHYAVLVMRSSLGVNEFPGVTAEGGTLDGRPFLSSNHIGGGQVLAISAPDILLADDGEVGVEMSDQASLEMLDGSLTQSGQAGTGASVVSLWQNGLVAIKCERFVNWTKARSAAVQRITGATYQGAATA